MTIKMNRKGKECYRCEECLLFYKDKETAEKCEEWCKLHKSCNLEITSYALNRENM